MSAREGFVAIVRGTTTVWLKRDSSWWIVERWTRGFVHLVFVRITVICGARTWQTRLSKRFFLPLFIEPPEQGQQQKCGGDGSVAIGEHDDAPPAITFHNPPTTAILRPSPATPCYQLASISTRSRYRSDRNISIPLRVGKSPHSEI